MQVGKHGVYGMGGYYGKFPEGDTLELGGPQIKEEIAALAPQLLNKASWPEAKW